MPRFGWVILGLSVSLIGCGESDEPQECASNLGTVSGMVFTDWECSYTAEDARLEFLVEGEETPLVVRPSVDGSFSVDLEAGSWQVRGFGSADSCTTEAPISFTVEACMPTTVDVCANLCMG